MLHSPEKIRETFDNFAHYALTEFTVYSTDESSIKFVKSVQSTAQYYKDAISPLGKIICLHELTNLSTRWSKFVFAPDITSRGHCERLQGWGQQIKNTINIDLKTDLGRRRAIYKIKLITEVFECRPTLS